MSVDKARIRAIVEDVVDQGMPQSRLSRPKLVDEPNYAGRELITEEEVMQAHREGRGLVIAADAIVTPSARDAMVRYGVKEENSPEELAVIGRVKDSLDGAHASHCAQGQVAIAADHGGFAMKAMLIKFLAEEAGISCQDFGTHSSDSVDYPDFAARVAAAVSEGSFCRGIIIDGAGIGSAMAANKFKGVRAAQCSDVAQATNAREHNDANILTLGGKVIGDLMAKAITAVFLKTDFAGGRHQGRIDKIIELER